MLLIGRGACPDGSDRLAQPLAPVRQLGAPFSLRSTEYAGRGAGRPDSAVEIRRTRVGSPASSKIASAKSARSRRRRRRRGRRRRAGAGPDVSRPRDGRRSRRAALVVDDGDLVPLLAQPQHRPDEVVPVGRRATRSGRSTPARRPRPRRGASSAVRRTAGSGRPTPGTARPCGRRRRSRWSSGRAGAERGDVPRSTDVDRGRALRIVLGAVDVRPGGGVQDDVRGAERGRRRQLTSHSARVRQTTPSSSNSSQSARASWPPAPVTGYTLQVALREDRRVRLQRCLTPGRASRYPPRPGRPGRTPR